MARWLHICSFLSPTALHPPVRVVLEQGRHLLPDLGYLPNPSPFASRPWIWPLERHSPPGFSAVGAASCGSGGVQPDRR